MANIYSKNKVRQGISGLYVDPTDPKLKKTDLNIEKANILANYFNSVFTIEPDDDIPSLDKREVLQEWTENTLTREHTCIYKILKNLKPEKSAGLDNLQPRLLLELANELSYHC